MVRVSYKRRYLNQSKNDEVIIIEKDDDFLRVEEETVKNKYKKAAQSLRSMIPIQFNENQRLVIIMPPNTRGPYLNTLYNLESLIGVRKIEVITDIPPEGY